MRARLSSYLDRRRRELRRRGGWRAVIVQLPLLLWFIDCLARDRPVLIALLGALLILPATVGVLMWIDRRGGRHEQEPRLFDQQPERRVRQDRRTM